ncbi:chemotaxis-specific protein-glutamate methyltransferase CheB [Caulobacter segnis]|uniref:chemotaxis-specific protein-glutamate methyltransferase CheB n=1 Tax=Caulobacter segnis TaxID=88688 RepID=UPI00240EF19E|nr:chemotaxis-specific protein-glutamate methyltransferase CheB [Caulobacter segnis]MDG2521011.1 chemotaxis-specific protein-glutamate methyltransferase CheB [Caulobacter segnis]
MTARPKKPVRVMIVEDSAVVRTLLTHIIDADPRLTVALAVASAEEALEVLEEVKPDVISMDIRLPGIDGLEATRRIMAEHPTPIVVIADSVEDSLKISLNALRAGALTVVEKPAGLASQAYDALADDIRTQLFIMSSVPVIRRRAIGASLAAVRPAPPQLDTPPFQKMSVLGIAASTGGPPALAKVIGALPADFPAPILLVQHMGAPFMEGFASWLGGLSPLPVSIAQAGEVAQPGRVYVAPGDRHLALRAGGTLMVSETAPVGGQRPSANVLFQSMAKTIGARGVGVLLTGMGEDGARGLLELRNAGGCTITEHESSTVVYGMPGAAVRMGASRASLPLDMIGPRLVQMAEEKA